MASIPLEKDLIYQMAHGRPTTFRQRQASAKSSYAIKKHSKRAISKYSSVNNLQKFKKENEHLTSSYMRMEKDKHKFEQEGQAKVNWQKLESLKADDLKKYVHDNVQVEEMIADEDTEDKEYLSVFNLNPENKNLQMLEQEKKQKLANYGVKSVMASPLANIRHNPSSYLQKGARNKQQPSSLANETRDRADVIRRNEINRHEELIRKRNRPGR